jgi:anti-sigma factor RsiW
MVTPNVQRILKEIDALSDEERAALESQLADRFEAEWWREVEKARQSAEARGIDESAVRRAIEEVRYGK